MRHISNRAIGIAALAVFTVLCFVVIHAVCPVDKHYQNGVDGYSLLVSGKMDLDESMNSVRTLFSSEHISLSIYAEPCETEDDKLVYVGYSNRFLENEQDITVIGQETVPIGDYSATLSRWSRQPLSHVVHDKRNYACFDIDAGTAFVYTLFFKYDDTVDYEKDIVPIANSFRLSSVVQQAQNEKLGVSAAPKLGSGAQAAYDRYFSEDAPLSWGLYSVYAAYNHSVIEQLEERLDYQFPVYVIYTHFGEESYCGVHNQSLYDTLMIACPDNQIPELTLQTVDDQQGNMLLRTLDGEFDQYLHDYAAQVAQFGKPVLFRLANEMNGDWCVYCAFHYCRDVDLFVEFYRYVFDIFQQEGADNAIWVWNPNHRSFPNFKWNNELMYYPGDAYVNVVGLTAYNTGNYYEGEQWSTFDELYQDLYSRASEQYAQPLMITEFASSSVGGDKVAWISDMFRSIRDYPRIKVAVWWSGCDMDNSGETPVPARPYYLDETDETTRAFAQGLHSQRERGGS